MLGVEVGGRDQLGAIHGTLEYDLHRRSSQLMRVTDPSFSPNIAALMFDISTPCLTEEGRGLAHGSRFYPIDEPRAITGKLRGFTKHSTAFLYLDDTMDEVLNRQFSLEAQSEIDRMNRIAQEPRGFFVAISKK